MKVSASTFAAHDDALLAAAGQLFTDRGIAAVTIAEISRAAGLTHGAFYGHYPTKDALAASACRRVLLRGADTWRARADAAPADPVGAIIDGYLTEQHRDEPAHEGCPLPAIGAEAWRAGPDIAAAFDDGTRALLDALTDALVRQHARPAAALRPIADAVLAAMVGGMMVARALAADPPRSRAALTAARAAARHLAQGWGRNTPED